MVVFSQSPLPEKQADMQIYGGQDSLGGIAPRHGLNGPRIEAQWQRDFPYISRPTSRRNRNPVPRVPGLFTRGKGARAWH